MMAAAPIDKPKTAKSYAAPVSDFTSIPEPALIADTSLCNWDIAAFKAATS